MSKMKRVFSVFMALILLLNNFPIHAFAEKNELQTSVTKSVEKANKDMSTSTEIVKNNEPQLSEDFMMEINEKVIANVLLSDNTEVEYDEDNPAIMAMEEDLDNIVVAAEGSPRSIPLTEEQKQTILYMYSEYLNHWKANTDVLGVQTPFFLSYNDNNDELGVLGEMFALAGISVDLVRAGYVSYDDITGMIMNFMFGDQLGVAFYGQAIKAKRDEVLNAIEDSGAKTEEQKLLVLNDWLAHNCTFDMPYLMNSGKAEDEKPMVAETPVKHEHYDDVYNVIYAEYEKQIFDQFYTQIYDGIKLDIRQQFYEAAIFQIVFNEAYNVAKNQVYEDAYNNAVTEGKSEEEANNIANETVIAAEEEIHNAANEAAETFVIENHDVIKADSVGFLEEKFSTEVREEIESEYASFIQEAETNGIEVDSVNAPGYKMTIDQIAKAQMDEPLEDLGGMTPNEAIPVYADQAAVGLTDGVLNYWQGHHIGALGTGNAVCLGYAKAFTYLVQSMHPEIYGVNGANTDMSVAANWKDAKDLYYNEAGELDINQNYLVDMVRITFDASISMFGQTQDNFNSDHFWNAVKVNGKWYYIDSAYNDIYDEMLFHNRVETEGNLKHLYFLFSHSSMKELYEGYYAEGGIKTLYADAATSKIYEDSWFSRIASNTYSDGENFYYIYDSTDRISWKKDIKNGNVSNEQLNDPADIKLVYHPITTTDASSNGDADYITLIDFNYRETNSNEEPEDIFPTVLVLNPNTGNLEEHALLSKLIRQHEEEAKAYPSINITTALYDGKLYFNLSNCILSYDLETGEVVLVKEYNTIYAKRDKTNPFGGMAFTVVGDADDADLMVENSPLAAMTIKADGNMYVSVATNYAFISGKDPHNSADQGSLGYEFEETNFNKDYNNYIDYGQNAGMAESMGYEEEINDNDEFMWSTNFVETLSMSHVAGTRHIFEEVAVDAHCGRNAYTENRCTTCGISEDGTREEVEDSAYGHHYLRSEETYYTKDENGNWNKGVCYVCTECKKALEVEADADEIAQLEEELAENDHIGGHEYVGVVTKWERDYSSATMDVMCVRCVDATLDILEGDKTIELATGVKSESVERKRVTITKTVVDEETGEETTVNEYYYDYTAVATVEDSDGEDLTVKSVPVERVERPMDDDDIMHDTDDVAYSGVCGENTQWLLTYGGTAIIRGAGAVEDASAIYYQKITVNRIVIEEGITSIITNAFNPGYVPGYESDSPYRFINITELILPDSLEIIQRDAFIRLIIEGDFIVSNELLEKAEGAFYDCSFNGNIIIEEGIDTITTSPFNKCFCTSDLIFPEGLKSIGNHVFGSSSNMDYEDVGLCVEGKLVLPNSLENIGHYAFCYNNFSGELVLPNSLAHIGDYAFYSCDFDGELTLPNRLETIGDYAFASCNSFSGELVLPENITFGKGAFENCRNFTGDLVIPEGVTNISDNAFYGCTGFNGQLRLPNSLYRIGDYAFYDCNGLIGNLTIPDKVIKIGKNAFYNCTGFSGKLVVPHKMQIIDVSAFSFCNGFDGDVFIPESVETIGNAAFYKADQIDRIIIPNAECEIYDSDMTIDEAIKIAGYYESSAYYYAKIYKRDYECLEHVWNDGVKTDNPNIITYTCQACGEIKNDYVANGESGDLTWNLSNGVLTFFGNGKMQEYTYKSEMPWFSHMDHIKEVVLKDGVTSVGDYAFYGMLHLESITIPDTVTSIGNYAFKNATQLNHVILPNGLSKLGESAFYGCSSLTSIDIPAGLWTIQPYTFKNCTSLEKVTFQKGNLQKISDGAFYNTALQSVVLPESLNILDVYVFKNCSKLTEVTIAGSLSQIREACFYGTAISEITIPEGIEVIKPYAFKNCLNLESVHLPETLQSIDEAAFYACTNLKTIDIPDAVTTIGNYAFRKCTGLVSVTFGSGLLSIGESSFYGCTGITSINIPKGVTTIQGYAFKGCSALNMLSLPTTLTSLGESAFHSCTGLKEFTIPKNIISVGAYCLSGSDKIKTITFLGDAPVIGTGAFNKITATAYYPVENESWTESVMQQYGGNIVWTAE